MSTVTENDLKELKDLIISQNQKIDNLTEKINNLTIGQTRLEAELKGIDKRLDGIEIFTRIVGGGIIVGLLLAFSKYLFFSGKI